MGTHPAQRGVDLNNGVIRNHLYIQSHNENLVNESEAVYYDTEAVYHDTKPTDCGNEAGKRKRGWRCVDRC